MFRTEDSGYLRIEIFRCDILVISGLRYLGLRWWIFRD